MKFTGEIRIPEVDHPGIPATILVEDKQIEVVLDGESLGRWSLVDVRARRLISSAFQLELDGEELTFIADEPMDFAYRGVEEMGEVWARINSLGPLKRSFAVRSSRSGVKPSRVAELRAAMEANLKVERRSFMGRAESAPSAPSGARAMTSSPEPIVTESDQSISDVGETGGDVMSPMAVDKAEADRTTAHRAEEGRLAEERAKLAEERAQLEGERHRLEELRREAEERDAQRIEAFRLEMARLEEERAEHLRIEAERAATFKAEMVKLQKERERLEKMEIDRSARAGEDEARALALKEEMARVENARREMERAEAERVAAAQAEMEAVDARRLELEQLEAERVEKERLETERSVPGEADGIEAGGPVEAADDGEAEPGMAEEVLGTSGPSDGQADEAEDDGARELVVDLGSYEGESSQPAPEPALAGATREKAGFMGAVKSAFTRGGRIHEHEFVEAPGGLGIARSICRECGYVSISTTD